MDKTSAKGRLREYRLVVRNEFRYIFRDAGVLLILFGAVLIYSTLYALAYHPEVLRNVPIAVVDESRSPSSREFARKLDAAPNLRVAYKPTSLEEAKQMFLRREVNGIVYLPKEFEKNILGNEKAYIGVYADASYFLMYKQVFMDIVAVMMDSNEAIEMKRFQLAGVPGVQAQAVSDPARATSRSVFNPYGGYGTFVMPAILVLIIQQTLLIGIGMMGGTWRELGLYRTLILPGRKYLAALPVVLGKSTVYFLVSLLTLLYVFGFHYKAFGYPMNGRFLAVAGFLLPYLLSVIFLGLTLSSVFKRRENSILILLFTSIPLLMISGVSVPMETMPAWLYNLGKIFPSSAGINGFLRIQSMGASLAVVKPGFVTLWILTGVYFLTACIGIRTMAQEGLRPLPNPLAEAALYEGEPLPDADGNVIPTGNNSGTERESLSETSRTMPDRIP